MGERMSAFERTTSSALADEREAGHFLDFRVTGTYRWERQGRGGFQNGGAKMLSNSVSNPVAGGPYRASRQANPLSPVRSR